MLTIQNCLEVPFTRYTESVPRLLDELGADTFLTEQKRILIKPNLINTSPPPVTTPVECCAAIADYLRRHCTAKIIIGEGCGAPEYETDHVFEQLGYSELAESMNIPLLDLNKAPMTEVKRDDCRLFPSLRLPKIAFESYILSIPVLKAHSLAGISGTLKNMLGLPPPAEYQRSGHWKKSAFHQHMQESIIELNRYVTPDLTVLDGRIGLAEHHLGGAECEPPAGTLVGGTDPLAVDRRAGELLGLNWKSIPHLCPDG